ncbi:proton-coupled folate transporter-like [Uloborus diversus]|uniref:proton-coupled folate transporter-like n=1 Tax=Uloborus diversus TaxID=327109 RepID=UPI002409EF2A|nr:proton-coupled folate transporter-like [Uloborus diversus]
MLSRKGKVAIVSEEAMKSMEPIELTKFNTLCDGPNHSSRNKIEEENSSGAWSILSEIKQMKVELLMFLYSLSFTFRGVSQITLIVDKVCLVHFNYSSSVCSNISYYPDVKTEVVKLANNYILGYNFLSFLTSSILVVFIGSWSDRYSRKVPLIVCLLGVIIDGFINSFLTVFMNTRVEFLFIPALINGLSGSFLTIMTILYSYITDISTESNRTMKYTIIQAAAGISAPIGMLASGYVFMSLGYTAIFLIATAGHILALLWTVFFIKETRGLENKESWKLKLRKLFSTENVIASYKTTMKKRPNKGKWQILLLMLCMMIFAMSQQSVATIGFSYVHHRYDWDNTKYSTVFGIFAMIGTIGTLFIVPMFKKLNLGDCTLGLVGSTSTISKSLLTGFASKEYLFYTAYMIGVMEMLIPLAVLSRISKVAPQDDIGKIFAIFTMVESVIPSLSTAPVSQIFNASLDFFPGLTFILLAVTFLIPLGIFIWIKGLPNADLDKDKEAPDINGSIGTTQEEDNKIKTTETIESSRF